MFELEPGTGNLEETRLYTLGILIFVFVSENWICWWVGRRVLALYILKIRGIVFFWYLYFTLFGNNHLYFGQLNLLRKKAASHVLKKTSSNCIFP